MSNAEQAIERVTQWAWDQVESTTEPDLLDDLILVLAIAREAVAKGLMVDSEKGTE